MNIKNKKLEAELESWADFAEKEPDLTSNKMEAVDVHLNLKRHRIQLELAPHIVEALEQRAKAEGKSVHRIVERWLTEKLFIEKS